MTIKFYYYGRVFKFKGKFLYWNADTDFLFFFQEKSNYLKEESYKLKDGKQNELEREDNTNKKNIKCRNEKFYYYILRKFLRAEIRFGYITSEKTSEILDYAKTQIKTKKFFLREFSDIDIIELNNKKFPPFKY